MSHLKNKTAETEKSEDFSVATRLLWCREVHKCLVHVAALDMRRLFSADLASLWYSDVCIRSPSFHFHYTMLSK